MSDQIWEQIEQTGLPEMPEIGRLQIRNAMNPMQTESHAGLVEFLLLCSGRKRIWVEDQCYEMQGGDLLVILPGERHGEEEAVQNRSSLLYLLIRVPTEGPGFCLLEREEREFLWERLRSLPSRKLQAPPSIRREMERIFAGISSEEPLAAARLRVGLMKVLFQVLDAAEAEKNGLPADIAAVIRFIREKRGEMPDVAQMAAKINLSESRFKQKFKHAAGMPPVEFMVREKIREAKSLLENGDRTITSVAMELGFSSSQHFSVLFKKYEGETPTQYRKNRGFVP